MQLGSRRRQTIRLNCKSSTSKSARAGQQTAARHILSLQSETCSLFADNLIWTSVAEARRRRKQATAIHQTWSLHLYRTKNPSNIRWAYAAITRKHFSRRTRISRVCLGCSLASERLN